MNEMIVRDMADSFGYIFLLSRRFEYITDQVLVKDDLTTKQLLALIAIEEGFETLPSITQLAEVLSTTHQNIKKIALQLEKKGFVEIIKDEQIRLRFQELDVLEESHLQAVQNLELYRQNMVRVYDKLIKQ